MLSKPFTALMAALVSALCATAIAGAGVGVWGPSHGPAGGDITAVAVDPTNPAIVYAGTLDGVVKSTDGGRSWRAASAGLGSHPRHTSREVEALAIDPRRPATVYAGSAGNGFDPDSSGGVFKSTDGGRSWQAASAGLGRRDVADLAIDRRSPATLYAGTWGNWVTDGPGGVFKSADGGRSWRAMNVGLALGGSVADVEALAIDPRRPATVYAGAGFDGVYKSTNGGRRWRAVNAGLEGQNVVALAIDPRRPATVYAGTEFFDEQGTSTLGGVFRSTNGGRSWRSANVGLGRRTSVNTLVIDPRKPMTVYAGTDKKHGVFRSTDGGRTWRSFSLGLPAAPTTFQLAISSTGRVLYAGAYRDGVFDYRFPG